MLRIIGALMLLGACTGDKAAESADSAEIALSGLPGDTGSTEPEPEPEPSASMLPGDFVGAVTTNYVYDGSFGHFEDACTGDVSFTIDEALSLAGTGLCVLGTVEVGTVELGFILEGQQNGLSLDGLLIFESSADRVETPFSGTRDDTRVQLAFDATHIDGAEQVRLFGTITAMLAP